MRGSRTSTIPVITSVGELPNSPVCNKLGVMYTLKSDLSFLACSYNLYKGGGIYPTRYGPYLLWVGEGELITQILPGDTN